MVWQKTLKHLKSTIFNSEQILDLHGFNIEDAYFEFRNFINHSYQKKQRTIKDHSWKI